MPLKEFKNTTPDIRKSLVHCTITLLIGLSFGLLIAFANNSGIFLGIIVWVSTLVVLIQMKRWYADTIVAESMLVRQHNADYLDGLEYEVKLLTKKKNIPVIKQTKCKHLFTDEIFDSNAINLLSPLLKEAKKNKGKITGHNMISVILKGMK